MMKAVVAQADALETVFAADTLAAWPTIARGDGQICLVFSGGRRHHIDPFGKTVLMRSLDEGKSWSKPKIINNSPLDDRDPGILQSKKGTWIISFFTSVAFIDWQERARKVYGNRVVDGWQSVIEGITEQVEQQYLGSFVRRSLDNCRTFGPPVPCHVSSPHGPIQLADGRLMMVGNDRQGMVSCSVSADDGAGWDLLSSICGFNYSVDIDLCEPHLVELKDKTLQCLLRANAKEEKARFLYASMSRDGGSTWSQPEKTSLWGLPPHLLFHSSGCTIVVFGHRRPPYGIRAAVSKDYGKSWSAPRTLMYFAGEQVVQDFGPDEQRSKKIYYQQPDIGYPASVELEDGSILTVFYGPVAAGKTGILSVRWLV